MKTEDINDHMGLSENTETPLLFLPFNKGVARTRSRPEGYAPDLLSRASLSFALDAHNHRGKSYD